LDPLFQENKQHTYSYTNKQNINQEDREAESADCLAQEGENLSDEIQRSKRDAKAKCENMTWRENEQTAPPRRVETYPMN
jgi:hypothetical protein